MDNVLSRSTKINPAPIMEKICDKFEQQSTHKVLLLSKDCRFPYPYELEITKGSAINFLHKKKYRQTIVSFSVNAHEFSELYKKGAPNIYDRLRCAWLLQCAGYEVRLRIDPTIPLKPPNVHRYSWKTAYRDHVKFILKIMHVNPARITLGTPRWFPMLPYWLIRADRKDHFFDKFSRNKELSCEGRWRLKNRAEVYIHLIKWLRKYGYEGPIALCKETVDVWNKVRMLPEETRCNCTL